MFLLNRDMLTKLRAYENIAAILIYKSHPKQMTSLWEIIIHHQGMCATRNTNGKTKYFIELCLVIKNK